MAVLYKLLTFNFQLLTLRLFIAWLAQLVEHVIGNDEVHSSIL